MLCRVIDYRAAETITASGTQNVSDSGEHTIMPVVRLYMVHDRSPRLLRFMQFSSAFAVELY